MAFAEGVREVIVIKEGARRIIVPREAVWDDFFDEPGADLGPRLQPPMQARDAF